uniref:ADP-ribosyl cyclase/cyclic ADP-ribose hydrolase n=1 Tax=Quercus lobata TaxID=97700 RepID=A0A7N2MGD3_QUELO
MKCKRESSPSPSSSSTRECKYEVFLSFRGEDTRNNFTDHLYAALNRMGIITFRDEEELERGKSISKLFEAIEESQIAIIIFSKSYASSKWCLDELAKINKCREEMRLEVFPIFYDVDPSDVRKQIGNFEQTFIDHQKCEDNIKKVETWRTALKEVANISGWHLQNRHESEFIQHVVKEMMKKLSSKSSGITRNFIGMDSTLKEFIPLYLGFENNVRMTGIYGMGGLGKTTLARAVYDEYRSHFEGSSFIANVREDSKTHGLRKLQKQLLADILEDKNIHVNNVYDGVDTIKKRLCRIKVLIVIDDVDHLDQLEKLAGGHDWFGLGSWIIITTRDEHVLIQHEVLNRYNSNGLKDDDALKLFCLKAFKNEKPKEGYMQLSLEVVKYANGLPLALVTLGSFLVGRTIDEWQSALPSFKKTKGEIFHILKLSYDGLEEMWKEIFLDIACFFRHWNKNEVIHILENCGFNARIGISVLMEKSLLSMDYNEDLGMHDLLQEMGEKIVRFESKGKLGMQSRLWLNNDLLNVLKDNMATNAIEAIVVRYKKVDFKFEEFLEVLSKMSNLRLMIINQTDILRFPIDHRHLDVPTTLRHLLWDYCPLKCLSCSSQPMELVHLELQRSYLEYLWQGVMLSFKLKFIDLSSSFYLIRTPDFSGVPILEKLNLSNCPRLVEIHPSIGKLSKLRYLHLKYCKSLTDLPSMSAKMQSLTVLDLHHCSKINSFPKFTGIMKSLSELNLGGTGIKKVEPSSIECLIALTKLDLSSCNDLKCLPRNMHNLRSLEKLGLFFCTKLKSLPRLPSTVRVIKALGCDSLKWSLALVKLRSWSQPLCQRCPYDKKSIPREFKILFHFLQVQDGTIYGTSSKREKEGSRTKFLVIIPSFFIQKVRNSINIELPSNWYNSKWIGFALWATCMIGCEYDIRARVIALGDMPQNYWAFELFTTLIRLENSICLLYLSSDEWFAIVGNGKCCQIKVIFETNRSTIGIDVSDCGFSSLYKQDVDEFNQTSAQCLIESFGEEVPIYKLTGNDHLNHPSH